MPPYRKRTYHTTLTQKEITERINNEFVSAITSGKYGRFSGRPVVEPTYNNVIQLWFYARKNETVAEVSFTETKEFNIVYAVSPLRHGILLLSVLVALVFVFFTNSGTIGYIGILAMYLIFVGMLSIDLFLCDADTIENFVKDRLLE